MPANAKGPVKPVLMTQDVGNAQLPYLLYEGRGPTIIFLTHRILALAMAPYCKRIISIVQDHRPVHVRLPDRRS